MKITIALFVLIAILESIQALACNNDIDCKKSPNTICSNGKCICKAKYLEKSGVCKAIIHGPCTQHSHCGVTYSVCSGRTKTCRCNNSYYPSFDKRTCKKDAQHLNDPCNDTYGCRLIANSVCSDDVKKCICRSSHTEVAGKCLGVFRAACTKDAHCDSFYHCVSNACMCRENVTAEDEHKCLDSSQNLVPPCRNAKECNVLEPPICTPETCIHHIGSLCVTDMDCGIENSICTSDSCQCKADYQYSSSHNKCEKV